jgi:RimJ/RimL family protein N-acetyltransferase
VLRYPDPPLAAGAVALRPWAADDLPLVEEAAGDPALLVGTTLPKRYTPAEGAAFIERQRSRQTSGEGLALAITLDGEAVGCATLMVRTAAVADLGYWLVRRARGVGVGGKAVRLLVEWALGEPEITGIEVFVSDDNVASQKLLERLGFVNVGRRRHRINDLDEELRVYRRSNALV